MKIVPRIVRLSSAPNYLGTNKNFFNAHIRPYLTEIPIGEIGVGFDRLELDQWVEYTKEASGRPPKQRPPWDKDEAKCLDFSNAIKSGALTKQSTVNEFKKVLEQATTKKRNGI